MALEALRRLIKQNNDLIVKRWAGIKEINVQVSALEVLTLGEVISTPASHPSFPQNLLWITDCRTWVKMPEGKTIPKTFFYYYYYFFLNTRDEALSCFIMILWRKIFHLKGIKTSMRYLLNNITCFYWWSTILNKYSREHTRKCAGQFHVITRLIVLRYNVFVDAKVRSGKILKLVEHSLA